ncbi:MAG: hypothetical protein CSA94_00770 [Bacteroidetes bacterium]|nr:MAG: hypothetical protein CSA94_00770 [Bacteroidota bacterium]
MSWKGENGWHAKEKFQQNKPDVKSKNHIKMNKYILSIGVIIFMFLIEWSGISYAQKKHVALEYEVINGDTTYIQTLKPFVVFQFKKRPDWRTRRLIRNIKKAYPYAKLASQKLYEYNVALKSIPNENDRKRLMKQAESELKAEFSDELKKLTFSQGRILLKLIDRETGNTSFELVKELRGNFSAFFWQTFARVFGLKKKYGFLIHTQHDV